MRRFHLQGKLINNYLSKQTVFLKILAFLHYCQFYWIINLICINVHHWEFVTHILQEPY